MKKLLSLALCTMLSFSLTACSEEAASSGEGSSSEPLSQPSSDTVPESSETAAESSEISAESQETAEPSEAVEITDPETGGTLIAYFSWSGNTEAMANLIQQETGGELFEITPVTPYTDDYNELLDIARQEQDENARPELASQVENWESYDTVFVGYPDWWSDAPMLVYTFLESYDWTGKTLIPFCTSGGSGFGRSLDNLAASAPGAAILDGLHVQGEDVENSAGEISDWIGGLELN